MSPDCKRCRKRGSGCWQHPDNGEEPKGQPAHKKLGPWEEAPGRCNARKLGGDGLCRQPAGWGTQHTGIGRCKRHAGSTEEHNKHAQVIAAREAQVTYGLPREVDPHTALLEEVHRTAGHVAWLALVIQSYEDPDALAFGKGTQVRKGDSWGDTPIRHAAPAVWLDLYARERRHLADVCKTAIACGIAERQVKLAEQHGEVIARVMKDFAKALAAQYGFDADDAPVSKAARKVLVAVAGQAAA